MGIFETILAILTNPAVDAELAAAGKMLVDYVNGLEEQDRAKVIALVNGLAATATAQVAAADQDYAATLDYIAKAEAAHDQIGQAIAAVKAQLVERVTAPFVAKPIVTL